MTWRKPQEDSLQTSKDKKEKSGGCMVHFFVALASRKSVISYEEYYGTLTGESFAEHVRQYFPAIFENSQHPRETLFLQDGEPRQESMAEQGVYG